MTLPDLQNLGSITDPRKGKLCEEENIYLRVLKTALLEGETCKLLLIPPSAITTSKIIKACQTIVQQYATFEMENKVELSPGDSIFNSSKKIYQDLSEKKLFGLFVDYLGKKDPDLKTALKNIWFLNNTKA